MKQRIVLFGLLSTMILSGCSSVTDLLNKDIGEEVEVDFSQMTEQDIEDWSLTNNLSRSIYDRLVALKEVSATHDVTFETEGQVSKKKLNTLEYYTEDGLQKAYFKEVIVNEDQEFPREYIVEVGTDEGQVRYNEEEWQEVEQMSYRQPTYITLVKMILDHMDESQTDQEGNQATLSYHIDDPEYVKEMIPFFNLPIMTSRESTGIIDLEADVDNKGFITNARVELKMNEGSKESVYQTNLTFEPQPTDTLEEKLDQQPEPAVANKDNFVKVAEENHHLQTLETYEYTVHETHGDNKSAQYYLLNLVGQTPVYGITSVVEDQELQEQDLMTSTHRYSLNDEQVEVKEQSLFNIYDYYVHQFQDAYTQLTHLEVDEEAEDLQRGYRKVYEKDFEGFKQAAKGMNTASLKKDGDAIYGIDYYIDQKNFQLTNVVFWSVAAGEDEVSDIITLQFGKVNEISPFVVGYNVDNKLWEEMKKVEGDAQQ